MTTTKQYDFLNRLTSVLSTSTGSSANFGFTYSYNTANQRTRCALADGSYWAYTNDVLGQVTSGKRYWPDGTIVAGQQFVYDFDDIGNRTSTQAGGDNVGQSLRPASYQANLLNQYTNRTVPGAVDIMGLELATNSVFVNGLTAYRKAEYFRQQLPATNATAPQWLPVSISATNETPVNGNIFVPQTPEQFTYDVDGNLLSDGRFNYTWDAENRLASVVARTAVGPQQSLTFEYDWKNRRISKTVSNYVSGAWVFASKTAFLYDGWNPIAELTTLTTSSAPTLTRSYLWGSDLSGSVQGAGGIGGLLQVSLYGTGQATNCFAAFDGNGNLSALVNAADGTISARYEYGPFGELLRATGPEAHANPLRFSTKYQDDETDLMRYEPGRYYNASHGCWLGRDPIEEDGGPNLYGFVTGDPVSRVDPLGLCGGGGSLSCGVQKIVFQAVNWQTKAQGEAQLFELLLIKFQQDDTHDPSACALAARAKVLCTLDGTRVPHGKSGMPYDDSWHTDSDHWSKEQDLFLLYPPSQLRGSLYTNAKSFPQTPTILNHYGFNIADWDYVAFDAPGFPDGELETGETVVRQWNQQAILFDKNTKMIVKQEDAGPGKVFRITGTYPNLNFQPKFRPKQ